MYPAFCPPYSTCCCKMGPRLETCRYFRYSRVWRSLGASMSAICGSVWGARVPCGSLTSPHRGIVIRMLLCSPQLSPVSYGPPRLLTPQVCLLIEGVSFYTGLHSIEYPAARLTVPSSRQRPLSQPQGVRPRFQELHYHPRPAFSKEARLTSGSAESRIRGHLHAA